MTHDTGHPIVPKCYQTGLYCLCVSSPILILAIGGGYVTAIEQAQKVDLPYIEISGMLYGFLGVPFTWVAHILFGKRIQNLITKYTDHKIYCKIKDQLLEHDSTVPSYDGAGSV